MFVPREITYAAKLTPSSPRFVGHATLRGLLAEGDWADSHRVVEEPS